MIYIPPLRGFVRTFVIICVSVFILQQFAMHGPFGGTLRYSEFLRFFGLVPELLFKGMVFQIITWMFLHGTFSHLLFNMLAVWMFGSLVEDVWGSRRFVRFVFVSGALTGILVALISLIEATYVWNPTENIASSYNLPTIGASGVIFAILIAVSRLFPNQIVLFFFVFPMKMKYFAYIMIGLEFYALYGSNDSGISNVAHLSGAAVGWILTKGSGPTLGVGNWLKNLQDRWHQQKMRKKLRVVRMKDKITYH